MNLVVPYGTTKFEIEIPTNNVRVIRPTFVEGLADEARAFFNAVRNPIGSAPLKSLIAPEDTLAVVIPDITRPFPSKRVLPWLLDELKHLDPEQITIINGTGSHRANTPQELEQMLGPEICRTYRIVNHNACDPATLSIAGTTSGRDIYYNNDYVISDRRIVLGFVEPHFFAGYSGGYKGIFPGIADIDSILHYHRAEVIADPLSTWGVMDGNPTQEQIRNCGNLLPIDFCINLTLNSEQQITGFFCGDVSQAHEQACRFVRSTAMVACEHAYPIVITTNSGYPLDQNLYQSVKGMSAAAQIVSVDGLIITIAQCREGFPEHGNFRKLLFEHDSPAALLETVARAVSPIFDQWEAQKLALIQQKAKVALFSSIPREEVEIANLEPISDISAYLKKVLNRMGNDTSVAVLPEGPQTIPYLTGRLEKN